jgi:hypothetical protein
VPQVLQQGLEEALTVSSQEKKVSFDLKVNGRAIIIFYMDEKCPLTSKSIEMTRRTFNPVFMGDSP